MNHEVNKSLRKKYLNAANIITFMRIVGTAVLLFPKPMSSLFLAVYTFTGLTDAFDGIVARKTGTASEFGSRLDSVADLLFYGVMLIKLLPVLWAALPREIWCAVAVILIVRLCAYLTAAIKYRRFASLHTYLNKLTGLTIFLIPYVLKITGGTAYFWAASVLALAASVEELIIHISGKTYSGGKKTIIPNSDKISCK